VVRYDLSSANDVPGRDPKNWQFQGSHNGAAWTTLDARTGETFASRFLTRQYPISNSAGYEYYRLNITTNNGDPTGIQLSEMAFTYTQVQPQLSIGINAGQIQLTWPSDHIGWRLEMQTNANAVGLGTNWVTVLDSMNTNRFLIPSAPANGNAFFRLVYP
jgi:hypothetical protein